MTSTTFQQIAIEKYGPAQTLAVSEETISQPVGDDEVAIAVKYSGINFADIQMRLGFYPDAPKKPFVPGYEVSGYVEEVGKNVDTLAVGDRVVAGTFFGGYKSRVTIPAYQAFPLPQGIDLAEGAAIPVNFFTAQIALFEMARVRAGDKVLIECATGGVGTLAIQMARHVGADVVGLTTSAHKKSYIEDLGATAYTREEFHADKSITGFDFILNASAGTELRKQIKRLGITGRVVCLGVNSGVKDGKRNIFRMLKTLAQTPRMSIFKLFNQNVGIFGLNALHVLEDETWVKRLTDSLSTVEDMQLKPYVGKVFGADEVAQAHEYLQTRQAKGKVILEW